MASPSKVEIAFNYMFAIRDQHELEQSLNKALQALSRENNIISLSSKIDNAYTDLVARLLGEHLSDWLSWYMWEADFGKSDKHKYWVDGIEYNPKEQSFVQFWNTVSV